MLYEVITHGGPWVGMEWNSWFTNRSFQLLAARGYAVLRVDFRGAGGYGNEWLDAGNGEFGAAMMPSAVAWLPFISYNFV